MHEIALKNLRTRLREARRLLARDLVQQYSERIAATLVKLTEFQQAEKIASYMPVQNEVDVSSLHSHICRERGRLFLPKLEPDHRLLFLPVTEDSRFTRNSFGILEPEVDPALACAAEDLDLILLPLLGFDEQGHRLGMGMGCYDRSLAGIRRDVGEDKRQRTILLGLAYGFQKLPSLDQRPWDVDLDLLITEERLYRFT